MFVMCVCFCYLFRFLEITKKKTDTHTHKHINQSTYITLDDRQNENFFFLNSFFSF